MIIMKWMLHSERHNKYEAEFVRQSFVSEGFRYFFEITNFLLKQFISYRIKKGSTKMDKRQKH